MSKGLKYAFGAIALYLGVAYVGGAKLLGAGTQGVATDVAAFEGRSTTNAKVG